MYVPCLWFVLPIKTKNVYTLEIKIKGNQKARNFCLPAEEGFGPGIDPYEEVE